MRLHEGCSFAAVSRSNKGDVVRVEGDPAGVPGASPVLDHRDQHCQGPANPQVPFPTNRMVDLSDGCRRGDPAQPPTAPRPRPWSCGVLFSQFTAWRAAALRRRKDAGPAAEPRRRSPFRCGTLRSAVGRSHNVRESWHLGVVRYPQALGSSPANHQTAPSALNAVPDRHQLGHPALALLLQQRHRIRPVLRRRPAAVGRPGHLVAGRLPPGDPFVRRQVRHLPASRSRHRGCTTVSPLPVRRPVRTCGPILDDFCPR